MSLPSESYCERKPVSDKEIWEAFRRGDKGALEYIYRQYIQDLYNHGMKIRGDSALVKDAIQELFVELWKSRNHLSPTDKVKFYLMKALKLKIYHQLKYEPVCLRIRAKEASLGEVVLPYESLIIQHQLREEQRLKLHQAIKGLPDRQKEIIHLLFYEGLSYENVAEMMAINVRSVYTLAWKSLSSLRKSLLTLQFWVMMCFAVSL